LVKELFEEVKKSLKYLSTTPITAEQHVEYKKFLEKCSKRVSTGKCINI
jgi:hypothetical protein